MKLWVLLILSVVWFSLALVGQEDDLKELWTLYNQGENEIVLETALDLLKDMPEDAELNLLVGRSLADLGRFREAVPCLERTVKLDNNNSWKKTWALNYLGMCYYAAGDKIKSRQNLESCRMMTNAPNASRSADGSYRVFGFDEYFKNWRSLETAHFVFHFAPGSPVANAEQYAAIREQGWQTVNSFFNARTPRKIDFFVWNHRDDMKKILGGAGFAKPEFCLIHSCHDQTVGHEMTHVISYHAVLPKVKTPLINEGVAVYFDLSGRDQLALARTAIRQKGITAISVKELWNNWTRYTDDITYPLAGAWADYLIKTKGKGKFLLLLANQGFDSGDDIYNPDLDELMENFEKQLLSSQ